jgi:methylated-DNA-[protein]-cysteine S-methyltransferase
MNSPCCVDIPWPLGTLRLVCDGEALTGVYFSDGRDGARFGNVRQDDRHPVLLEAHHQLREYWEGRRTAFDLVTRAAGTSFQRAVWDVISSIPFAETISYRELGERAGSPRAIRAAGLATGRNPLSIVVPCHRVIGSDGKLTGYGGGLQRKEALLAFERAVARGDRIALSSFTGSRHPLLATPVDTAHPH